MEVVGRAVQLARAMRQKNQIELNLSTGAKGEALEAAAQESKARAGRLYRITNVKKRAYRLVGPD